MSGTDFFERPSDQSAVKLTIVRKYFGPWARLVGKRPGRLAYIDLFAGPGQYRDGTKSTPLLVLESAIADPNLCQRLVAVFNDADSGNCRLLREAIAQLPGISALRYPPDVRNTAIGGDIAAIFEPVQMVPTLFFVDPWGYKGLSLRLINSLTRDWGCESVFFFNYNRINMAITNPIVVEHMNDLFGEERAAQLRQRLGALPSGDRELTIVEEIAQALKGNRDRFVLPFRFRDDSGNRTKHHLIFVTKSFRGYEIMKEIMARESTVDAQGVPSFEYSPARTRQPLLFNLSRPLDELEGQLLSAYAGRTLTMKQVYEDHSVDRPFLDKHYKQVLRHLEEAGAITASPPANKRVKRHGVATFADAVRVTFPARSG